MTGIPAQHPFLVPSLDRRTGEYPAAGGGRAAEETQRFVGYPKATAKQASLIGFQKVPSTRHSDRDDNTMGAPHKSDGEQRMACRE